jgi:hypothetical protein
MAAPWYGAEHQRIRKALLASGYWLMAPCPRCGLPMRPGERLDLDHTDDRTGYLGLSHSRCNQAAGSRIGSANRKARRAALRSPAERAKHNHLVAVRQRRAWKLADQEFEKSEHGRVWLLVRPSGTG